MQRASVEAALLLTLLGGCHALLPVGTSSESRAGDTQGAERLTGDRPRPDRGVDSAGKVDARCTTGFACGNKCVPRCRECLGSALLCEPTRSCTGSCASCTDRPIECFRCNPPNRSKSYADGTCEPAATAYCLTGGYSGEQHCDCDSSQVKNCPGLLQVCLPMPPTDYCLTCGEPSSAGKPCNGGGFCDESLRQCK